MLNTIIVVFFILSCFIFVAHYWTASAIFSIVKNKYPDLYNSTGKPSFGESEPVRQSMAALRFFSPSGKIVPNLPADEDITKYAKRMRWLQPILPVLFFVTALLIVISALTKKP